MSATGSKPMFLEGLEIQPGSEPGRFYYLPKVQPELSPAGESTLLLLKQGAGGILQLGVQFAVAETTLDKIRATLSADASGPIRLQPTPFNTVAARLLLCSPEGEQELGRAQPAGLPPNNALFRVALTAEQAAAVETALSGKSGVLKVVYDIDRLVASGAQAQIEGDATAAAQTLPAGATVDQARGWLRQALASGQLRRTLTTHGDPAEPLIQEAVDDAETKAAQFVLALQNSTFAPATERADKILSEIRLEQTRTRPESRECDLGSWFAGGKKASIITAPASASPPPDGPSPLRVHLGFEAKDAPIAFIEIRGSAALPVILRGPQWAPVVLNSTGELYLTVHYTSSAPAFLNEIAAPGPEHALALEELGVARIVVDASARKVAGARKLAATVRYLRAGEELDNRPVRFQYGDWIEEWFQVTGAAGLNGSLECQWKETGADGAEIAGSPITTDHPVIQIR